MFLLCKNQAKNETRRQEGDELELLTAAGVGENRKREPVQPIAWETFSRPSCNQLIAEGSLDVSNVSKAHITEIIVVKTRSRPDWGMDTS